MPINVLQFRKEEQPSPPSVQQVVGVVQAGPEVPHLVLLLSLLPHCQGLSQEHSARDADDRLALPQLLHKGHLVVCNVCHLSAHRLQLSRFRIDFHKVVLDFIVWRRFFFAATFTLFFDCSFLGSFREKFPGRALPYCLSLQVSPGLWPPKANNAFKEVRWDSLSLTTFVRWPLTDVKWLYAKRKAAVK